MKYEDISRNVTIMADRIQIGDNVSLGRDISVKLRGTFSIGSYSRLGSNTQILGNNISLGAHLFNSAGLRVGGGGRQHPNANLTIGDRCTIHNNFINVCEPVTIGDDVGLSPETSILTHGYWMSVLEGFPASFSSVQIGNGVIIGYRSLVMMGVSICDEAVVGAQSVVSRSICEKGIYAGSPAKMIRRIEPLSYEERVKKLEHILAQYREIAEYHGIAPRIHVEYPYVHVNGLIINVETFEYQGIEDDETDDFRDYIRKWGIRVYTHRPFVSMFSV